MPVVQPPAKVLVSGATGYVATWVVQALLERGYAVRGTARSIAKGDYLKKQFARYGDRFEVVIVEDIAQDGAFDEAVKGVDAVEHTASPAHFHAVDPDELIKPAVNGTVRILKSILKDSKTKVKRVVITSIAAIMHDVVNPTVFTGADWNDQSLDILKKYEDEGKKNEAPNMAKYEASKVLAERSAWELVNKPENKSRIKWDLVAIHPPYVFGVIVPEAGLLLSLAGRLSPFIASYSRGCVAGHSESAALFYNYVANGAQANAAGNDFLADTGNWWIDVRDLGKAHMLALEKEAARGERIIVGAGPWKLQDFIDAANDLRPAPKLSTTLPVGVRDAGKTSKHLILFDTSKADRILGLEYRTIAETTRDTFADYEKRGW